jgi:hypothetical protein
VPFRPPVFGGNSQRDYAQRRGSARAQGFSCRWDPVSRQYRRANPLCVGCAAVGRTTLAQLVDHIVPHKRAGALSPVPRHDEAALGADARSEPDQRRGLAHGQPESCGTHEALQTEMTGGGRCFFSKSGLGGSGARFVHISWGIANSKKEAPNGSKGTKRLER